MDAYCNVNRSGKLYTSEAMIVQVIPHEECRVLLSVDNSQILPALMWRRNQRGNKYPVTTIKYRMTLSTLSQFSSYLLISALCPPSGFQAT